MASPTFRVTHSEEVKLSPLEFIWRVNIDETKATGDCLYSPKFGSILDSKSYQWELQLLLIGTQKRFKDVFIYLRSKCETKINASFSVALINLNDEKLFEIVTTPLLFEPNKSWGLPVCSQIAMKDPKHNLLNDNILSIFCRIETAENIVLKNHREKQNIIRIREFDKFDNLMNDSDFSDVSLIVGKITFKAHKAILASRSPVFAAMFKHEMKENIHNTVNIDDVEPQVVQELIRFMYTGKVCIIKSLVCDLLTIAEKYLIEEFKEMCEQTMCCNFTDENAIEYLCTADMNNADTAKVGAINYICENIKTFMKKVEFEELGKTHPEIIFKIMKTCMES